MTVTVDLSRIGDLIPGIVDDVSLKRYSEAAVAVVDGKLGDSGLGDARLSMIAEHLTAHYLELAAADGGRIKTSERLPDYSVSYASEQGLSSLSATRNGRIAIELDTSGTLAELSKPKPAFAVL